MRARENWIKSMRVKKWKIELSRNSTLNYFSEKIKRSSRRLCECKWLHEKKEPFVFPRRELVSFHSLQFFPKNLWKTMRIWNYSNPPRHSYCLISSNICNEVSNRCISSLLFRSACSDLRPVDRSQLQSLSKKHKHDLSKLFLKLFLKNWN